MSYRIIEADIKVNIVLRMIKGESTLKLAKEYNIPPKTMYTWNKKAVDVLYKIFEHNPPGPKRKLLKNLLNCVELSQNIPEETRECPNCNSTKVIKNGSYKLNSGVVKQRLRCKICLFQAVVEKKTT